jgi:hypothetical protein
VISILALRSQRGAILRVVVVTPERRWKRLAAIGMHRAGFPESSIATALGIRRSRVAALTEGGLFAGLGAEIRTASRKFDREVA